jgi:hypothetical protein
VDGLGFTWSLHLVCACLSWTFAAPGVLILIGPAVRCCLDQSEGACQRGTRERLSECIINCQSTRNASPFNLV